MVWTVVVAGGTGHRFGGPKQFEPLDGGRIIDWSLRDARRIGDGVVVVVPAEYLGGDAVVALDCDHCVAGGATRSASVRAGLGAVPAAADVIVVHDAARPFAGVALFREVVAAVTAGADGAVPGVAVTDTIKQVDAGGFVVATPERSSLVAVQTPQAFRAEVLRRAHTGAAEGTDDAALVEAIGGRVVVVPGHVDNRKITVPDDLVWARARARGGAS